MERQHSNVGNFIFQHKEPDKDENKNKVLHSACDEEILVPVDDNIDNCNDDKVRMTSSAKLTRAPLNYSQALMMIEIKSNPLCRMIHDTLINKMILTDDLNHLRSPGGHSRPGLPGWVPGADPLQHWPQA